MWRLNCLIFIATSQLLKERTAEGFTIKENWIKDLLPPSDLLLNLNGTLKNPIFSCLEEEGYEAVSNYVNCHLFCPSCNQGFGKCITAGDQKLCICECQYPVQLHKECHTIKKYCRNEMISEADKVMKKCKEACSKQGYSDGALCGLDDPPFVSSTCTCLCPEISL